MNAEEALNRILLSWNARQAAHDATKEAYRLYNEAKGDAMVQEAVQALLAAQELHRNRLLDFQTVMESVSAAAKGKT